MKGFALALVGAQWGSEGKGVIAGKMAWDFEAAVRVGGPNAGHSLYHQGQLFKMRSVPCLWVNPLARLFIGAGAVVNPELLVEEVASLPYPVLVEIDPVAVLIKPEYEHTELAELRSRIGSTAEGVGEARVDRIRRRGDAWLAGNYDWDAHTDRVVVRDVAFEVHRIIRNGGRVMLEGTQGSRLSLYHGTQYPYATSSDTNASGLASEAGIPPTDLRHTHLVARTYPIRVAGNSGPMGKELSWEWFISEGIVDAPEQTTVTKKVRRIGEWNDPEFGRAVLLNDPCGVWLTFGDYYAPELRGSEDWEAFRANEDVGALVDHIEAYHRVPVLGIGSGPRQVDGVTVDFAVAKSNRLCRHGDPVRIDSSVGSLL